MALEFSNALSNYVTVADVSEHRTTPLTICGWVKLSAYPSGTSWRMMAKSVVDTTDSWLFRLDEAGIWFAGDTTDEGGLDGCYMDAGRVLSLDTWYFIGFQPRAIGAGSTRAFKNAVIGGGVGANGTIVSPATTLYLGYPEDTFSGLLEDIRIYNRIITQTELNAIYNGGLGGGIAVDSVTSGLLGHWTLTGTAGTSPSGANSVLDTSGLGYHGTPTGSPVYRAGILPTPATGNGVPGQRTWRGIGPNLILKQQVNG